VCSLRGGLLPARGDDHPASVSPKSTNRWKGQGIIRVVRVRCSQKHPLLTLQILNVRKWGTRIPLGQCGDDGGREMNPIGCSRTRLSSSPLGCGRSPGLLVTREALSWPGVSQSCHRATRPAIRLPLAPPTRIHHHLQVILSPSLVSLRTQKRHGRARRTNCVRQVTVIQWRVEPRRERYDLFLRPSFTLVLPSPLSLVVGYPK
jgi:hypothetical protein